VQVNQRQLAVSCQGQGGPTVVLLSGQGVPAVSWAAPPPAELQPEVMLHPPFGARQPVQPALAKSTRVCVYDRPGLGSSDDLKDAAPRTVADAVGDLHALLATLSPGAPVILAGHSMGGLIAFEYTRTHPGRVAGLVLVDATHPDERSRLAWLFPANPTAETQAIARHPEHLDARAALSRGVDAVPPGVLGPLPLVVLTRTEGLGAAQVPPFGPAPSAQVLGRWRRDVWSLAAEYASASSVGTLMTAGASGHFIGFDRPDLVVAAVGQVVRDVRAREQGAGR
jgi:pimeloyl-ACP methyl ester carboxylesterase